MQVQNKLQQATSRLPQEVKSRGVTVTKGGNDFLLIVSMYSRRRQRLERSTSATTSLSSVVDVISRIDGVGDVQTLRHRLRHAHLAGSRTSCANMR
jgi:multidrug efflux pump subunit AcrB